MSCLPGAIGRGARLLLTAGYLGLLVVAVSKIAEWRELRAEIARCRQLISAEDFAADEPLERIKELALQSRGDFATKCAVKSIDSDGERRIETTSARLFLTYQQLLALLRSIESPAFELRFQLISLSLEPNGPFAKTCQVRVQLHKKSAA